MDSLVFLAPFIPSFRLALRVKKMNRLSLETGPSLFYAEVMQGCQYSKICETCIQFPVFGQCLMDSKQTDSPHFNTHTHTELPNTQGQWGGEHVW